MKRELDPARVVARLAVLRSLYVPESLEDARERLARERPSAPRDLATRVAANLAELRALYELARHLNGRAGSPPTARSTS